MADVTQSFSQLLLTYGPGAMMDLPDNAVVVSGLQGWHHGGQSPVIEEERLVTLLKQQLVGKLSPGFSGLRQPPFHDEDRHDARAPGVEVIIFPTWFTADEASSNGGVAGAEGGPSPLNEKRRRMVEFGDCDVASSGKLAYSPSGGKKVQVNPVRFVAACTKGHLQDIDWRFLVHRNGDRSCRKPLYWVEQGVSSDPSDISIRCTCGQSATLADLYKPKFLGSCGCRSPWLYPPYIPGETCDNDLRLLPRSATNTYFPQAITVISLTKSDDRVRQVVAEHRSTIDGIKHLPNFIDILRSLPMTKEAFSAFSDDEIRAAVDSIGGEGGGAQKDPRIAEFDLLASGKPTIGADAAGSFLFAETLDRASLALAPRWNQLLQGVVQVHRLREVTCLYGFTRLEPPPTAAEAEMDEIRLNVDGADLSRNVTWLPAIEQFGEGIFLHVASDFLKQWLADYGDRAALLRQGEQMEAERFKRDPKHLGAAYWALHSLSHAVMAELALACGYPISSIKERIYASSPGQPDRFGILIYTSTAGGQGTLGGLSSMAVCVSEVLTHAIDKLALCSNDPICAEHNPGSDHDDRPLHGAACHACLLLPETSCEARNTRLDRSLLVDMLVGAGRPMFTALDD